MANSNAYDVMNKSANDMDASGAPREVTDLEILLQASTRMVECVGSLAEASRSFSRAMGRLVDRLDERARAREVATRQDVPTLGVNGSLLGGGEVAGLAQPRSFTTQPTARCQL